MRGKARQQEHLAAQSGITPACAGKSFGLLVPMHRTQDHPRVCGEKVWALVRAVMALGSPPHVRGKVHLTGAVVVGGGITPAYAGKRQMARKAGRTKPDHPRVCGEKPLPDPERIFQVGSPPRMRGKVCGYFVVCRYLRITPAYAGKSRP